MLHKIYDGLHLSFAYFKTYEAKAKSLQIELVFCNLNIENCGYFCLNFRFIYFSKEILHNTKCNIEQSLSDLRIDFGVRCVFETLYHYILTGDSANAVPHTNKLRTRVAHIWSNRRLQPNRSAMERPRPGETAFLITVLPVPGKYA